MNIEKEMTALREFFPEEELLPELQPYLQEHPRLGACIYHPLVVEIAYGPVLAGNVNQRYRWKVEQLAEAKAEGNWSMYVWLHERGYRSTGFETVEKHLSDDAYWALLRDVWIDTENLWQWGEHRVRRLLEADRAGRAEHLMTDEERASLAAMPERITIHRGWSRTPSWWGWSWTTNVERAEWFARRFAGKDDDPQVATAVVPKSKVIAYITGRNEEEIIFNPRRLPNKVKVRELDG